jgi:hypothetical protein
MMFVSAQYVALAGSLNEIEHMPPLLTPDVLRLRLTPLPDKHLPGAETL